VNFRAYFRHLFEQPEKQVAAATVMRNFSIWFSDFSAISFWSVCCNIITKRPSTFLFYVHQLALHVVFRYVDQWYLNLFCFMESRTTAHRLNVAANVLIGILLFMLINKATSIMVAEFSQAHSR
jgi:hypothetical protein